MKAMAQQFGQSAKQNAMALRMYAWQMRVEITLKGDPQSAKLFAMRFDPDVVVQQTALNPAPPAPPTTTNNATGVTTRTTQSSAGSSARVTGPGGSTAAVARSNSGDLYAGHDGNVYKKDSSGGYQKYDNGSWSTVQPPRRRGSRRSPRPAPARAAQVPTRRR
jgi:hypothetical protein